MNVDSLAQKIAPKIRENLEEHKEEIIAAAGNMLKRNAVRMAFPTLLDEIPNLAHVAIELVSEEFGKLNVNDLIEFLDHQALVRQKLIQLKKDLS